MKLRALLLLAVLAFAGCASIGGTQRTLIDSVLDATLPHEFTGYARFKVSNPLFTIRIEADGLIRGPNGWNWVWLTYVRDGAYPGAEITIGRPPIPAVLPPFSPPSPVP